jgi:hypothetical protein
MFMKRVPCTLSTVYMGMLEALKLLVSLAEDRKRGWLAERAPRNCSWAVPASFISDVHGCKCCCKEKFIRCAAARIPYGKAM